MPGTTLVTGASSGIGRELAILAAKERRDVVLVARRREGAKRGKRVVVPGVANRILAVGARFSPRTVATKIARRLQEKRTIEAGKVG